VAAMKTGIIVRLKSGGPKMTVANPPNEPGRNVHCQWFSGSKLEQGYFPVDSLVIVDESEEKKK
jgi:uncharacterized protein YodC (DUF2158 family)